MGDVNAWGAAPRDVAEGAAPASSSSESESDSDEDTPDCAAPAPAARPDAASVDSDDEEMGPRFEAAGARLRTEAAAEATAERAGVANATGGAAPPTTTSTA